MVACFVALGSNLGESVQTIRGALVDLDRLPETRLLEQSSLYRTEPVGPHPQPDFINAVAALETELSPQRLLDHLLAIELAHGRLRGADRWTARTLDLDLLLYGDWQIDTPTLSLPHPRLHERRFVLEPLLEIAPGLELPGGQSIADCLRNCPDFMVQRITGS